MFARIVQLAAIFFVISTLGKVVTAQSNPSDVTCNRVGMSDPVDLFLSASLCGMDDNSGFTDERLQKNNAHFPWLQGSGQSNPRQVDLEVGKQVSGARFRAYWVNTDALETALWAYEAAKTVPDLPEDASPQSVREETDKLLKAKKKLQKALEDLIKNGRSLVSEVRHSDTPERSYLTVQTPYVSGNSFRVPYTLIVIGLPEDATQPSFATIAQVNILPNVSAKSIVWTVAILLSGFLLVGLFNQNARLFKGFKGHLSLSSFQIALFSCVVLLTLVSIYVRTGTLSGVSQEVLLLMGISAAGGGGAKVSERFSQKLNPTSVAWLESRGLWYKPATYELAQLFLDKRGDFDVFRAQAFGFSFLVAYYLFDGGVLAGSLEAMEIPQSLLGVLGLSQVTYIGGKSISSAKLTDLHDLIKEYKAISDKNEDGTPNAEANEQREGKEKVIQSWVLNNLGIEKTSAATE